MCNTNPRVLSLLFSATSTKKAAWCHKLPLGSHRNLTCRDSKFVSPRRRPKVNHGGRVVDSPPEGALERTNPGLPPSTQPLQLPTPAQRSTSSEGKNSKAIQSVPDSPPRQGATGMLSRTGCLSPSRGPCLQCSAMQADGGGRLSSGEHRVSVGGGNRDRRHTRLQG